MDIFSKCNIYYFFMTSFSITENNVAYCLVGNSNIYCNIFNPAIDASLGDDCM